MSYHTVFILRQKSPIIGQLDSIKLFGAITSALSELNFDMMDQYLKSFEDGTLRISSVFPVIKNNKANHFFLPIPKIDFEDDLSDDEKEKYFSDIKKLKKIKYVSKNIFELIINQKLSLSVVINKIKNEWCIKNKTFLVEINEKTPEMKTIEVPRNSLNRYTGKSKIFYTNATIYNGCDMFFLVKGNKENKRIIESAIKFLEDRGFGQDYSTGFGNFEYLSKEEIEIKEPESESCVNLSLFYPKGKELSGVNKQYSLREIKGITQKGMHIPAVIFIEEGSCFDDNKLLGSKYTVPETQNILAGYIYTINIM